LPSPPTIPNQKYSHARLSVKEDAMNATVMRMAPVIDTGNGPILSCSRPATTNDRANTITAMLKVWLVWSRFQPNSFSRGAT
jgi:hypothetical protein